MTKTYLQVQKESSPTWLQRRMEELQALKHEVDRMNVQLAYGKLASFCTSESFISSTSAETVTRMTTWYLTRAEALNHNLMAVWLRLQAEPEKEVNLDVCFLENGERWVTMMVQVGEPRHPLFVKSVQVSP